MRATSFSIFLPLLVALGVFANDDGEMKQLRLRDEVVCRVNTEAISKLTVEERMGYIPIKIEAMRQNLEQSGQLTKETEAKLDEMYRGPFRDALRGVVRERLIQQAAKAEKVQIDEKQFQKRYQGWIDKIRADGNLGQKGLTPADIQKKIR
ncbi:MAG TPA: hypothetical protein VEJ63_01115, partial [Planctomycetota bacterium]|nr:hypothetical protein [Planctomycetota bacterium]